MGANVTELLVNGQLFFGSDTEGFVELPAHLEDVGGPSPSDGSASPIVQSRE